MVERTVLLWIVGSAGGLRRMGVRVGGRTDRSTRIVVSTGGFTADGRRSGWYSVRFYYGLMVECAVVLIR